MRDRPPAHKGHAWLGSVAAVALAVLTAFAATASAHQGDPRYRSVVRGIVPATSGLSVQVLGYDDQMELVNRTGQTVMVMGYNREPYARLAADGTVSVNHNSPAYYLNEDRFGAVDPPAAIAQHPRATPDWRVLDRTGRFVWHDHRMHWMVRTIPPRVTDRSKKTKVFDYAVPLSVGGRAAAIDGALYWIGQPSGFPLPAAVALAAIALLAAASVVFVRRRRAAAGAGGAAGRGEPAEPPEAGAGGAAGRGEPAHPPDGGDGPARDAW